MGGVARAGGAGGRIGAGEALTAGRVRAAETARTGTQRLRAGGGRVASVLEGWQEIIMIYFWAFISLLALGLFAFVTIRADLLCDTCL